MRDGAMVQAVGVDAEMALLGVRFCAGGCGNVVSQEFCSECKRLHLELEARRRIVAAYAEFDQARRTGQLLELPVGVGAEELPPTPPVDWGLTFKTLGVWLIGVCLGWSAVIVAAVVAYQFWLGMKWCVALLLWVSR